MIQELLEDDYIVLQLFTEPGHVGHSGIARKRTYIFCSHRTTGRYLFDIHVAYNLITARLKNVIHTSPSDYMVAPPEHIRAEAFRTAVQRKVAFKDTQPSFAKSFLNTAVLFLLVWSNQNLRSSCQFWARCPPQVN